MPIFAFFNFSPMDMLIVGVIAVLLFGDRLPQVMRSLGQGMSEFKKGMRGIQDQIEAATSIPDRPPSNSRYTSIEQREEPVAPRFEPPPAEPRVESKPGEPAQSA